ncbi:MAG: hypothetical protein K6B54_02930 [Clostridia bacterium]|nr:hypothetical protein [Clostridia bacterium]
MSYRFYGNENCNIKDARGLTPRNYYDILDKIWCEDTCAPHMRKDWSAANKTLGQCSITAFLMQDLYGGKVYGIILPDGIRHCFNVVGDVVFDLTSEQFQGKKLDYSTAVEQSREEHFLRTEKKDRYLYLKEKLEEAVAKR